MDTHLTTRAKKCQSEKTFSWWSGGCGGGGTEVVVGGKEERWGGDR